MSKLVRDQIPEIITAAGRQPQTKTLTDDQQYYQAILAKLAEEATEIKESADDHLLEELGDLETLIDTILQFKGLTRQQLSEQQQRKDQQRGTFSKRILLVDGGNNV